MGIFNLAKRQAIRIIEWFYAAKYTHELRKQHAFISGHFANTEPCDITKHPFERVFDFGELSALWVYKDESWNYIKNLSEYRKHMQVGQIIMYEDNLCRGEGHKYTIDKNALSVNAPPLQDNWLCFFLKGLTPDQFVLSFEAEIYSVFTEIQIAFRYMDLGNRYRFMIRNNCEAVFECVYNGEFYHSIRSVPFQLGIEKKSLISVIVLDDQFQLLVDGKCIFSIHEKNRLVDGNDVGLILWNVDDSAPIKCKLSNICLAVVSKENVQRS